MNAPRIQFDSMEFPGVITGPVTLVLDPTKPELCIQTQGGRTCILRGEDLARFQRWLTEPGYDGR